MKVLFVCTVNTCRSVMAEAIFNNEKSLNKAKSVGISVINGSVATDNTVEIISEKLNLNVNGREAVELKEVHLKEADIVLTMTNYSRDFIKVNFPNYKQKIYSICEYAGIEGEITDPYGGSISVYEKTYKELKAILPFILDKIEKDGSI